MAAINDASELGTIAEMHAPIPGRAQLTIWRRDPLDMVQPVPWRPGERPSCCKPGQVCMGLFEIRGWWASDQWHADHVGLLAARRVRS